MQSPIAQWLVAGRFMRGFYAAIKGILFCWLLLIHPWSELMPGFWAGWGRWLLFTGDVLIWLTVFLCVIRGLPVIIEFMATEDVLPGRSAGDR